jgi:glycosyltransferase involved in cell wall biosynthesis
MEFGKKPLCVVVTVYNDGQYLADAVNSWKNADPELSDILLVNDGSTDELTLKILSDYEKLGYPVLHKPNGGLSSARNEGIRHCPHNYILTLDADNKIRKGYIRQALLLMDADSKVGLVYSDYQKFGGSDEEMILPDYNAGKLLRGNYIDACAVFRKSAWEKCGGFDENLKTGYEDWDMWIRIGNSGYTVEHLPFILFDYRVKDISLSTETQKPEVRKKLHLYLIDKHKDLYLKYADDLIRMLYNDVIEFEVQNKNNLIQAEHQKNISLHELAQAWQGRLDAVSNEYEQKIKDLEKIFHENLKNQLAAAHREHLYNFEIQRAELRNAYESQMQHLSSALEKLGGAYELLTSRLKHTDDYLKSLQTIIHGLEERIRGFESSKYYKLKKHWARFRLLMRSGESVSRKRFRWVRRVVFMISSKGRVILRRFLKKIFRALYIMFEEGPVTILVGNTQFSGAIHTDPYSMWLQKNAPRPSEYKEFESQMALFNYKPLISVIVPVYNPPPELFRATLESVKDQLYENWELCISDDCSTDPEIKAILDEYRTEDERIRVVYRQENGHISACSNTALDMAKGEFCALLDHDDLLTKDALFHVVKELNLHKDTDLIYTDEDKIDEQGVLSAPHFKPHWCPDTFLSRNYFGHLVVCRTEILKRIGGFRLGFEGSQDYDMLLRFTEETQAIRNIPRILYHWRIHSKSAASGEDAKPYAYQAAKKALTEACERRGEPARVEFLAGFRGYSIRYELKSFGKVSVIIPTRNKSDVLEACVNSLFEKTEYPDFEVILLSNNSDEKRLFQLCDAWKQKYGDRFILKEMNYPFNFSKLMNDGAALSSGEYLLLLNNDTEIIHADWMSAMVEQAQRKSIGAVGCKLLYPNDTIQHAGVLIGLGGAAGHAFTHIHRDAPGYFNYIQSANNYSAVTAACLMVRKEAYLAVKGFDENFVVEYNDVDFCLRLMDAGLNNIYLPHVELYHYESLTRGHPHMTKESYERHIKELDLFKERWQKYIDDDPCYSPNLSRGHHDFSLALN